MSASFSSLSVECGNNTSQGGQCRERGAGLGSWLPLPPLVARAGSPSWSHVLLLRGVGRAEAPILHCDDGKTEHAPSLKGSLLFHATSLGSTFKNSHNLLVVAHRRLGTSY